MAATALDPPPRDYGMVDKGADVVEDDDIFRIVVIDQVEPQKRIEKKKTQQNWRAERKRKFEEFNNRIAKKKIELAVAIEPQRKEKKRSVRGGSRGSGQKESRENHFPMMPGLREPAGKAYVILTLGDQQVGPPTEMVTGKWVLRGSSLR